MCKILKKILISYIVLLLLLLFYLNHEKMYLIKIKYTICINYQVSQGLMTITTAGLISLKYNT